MIKPTYHAIRTPGLWIIIDADSNNSIQGETNYDQSIHCVIENDDLAHSDSFTVIAQNQPVYDVPMCDFPDGLEEDGTYLVELKMVEFGVDMGLGEECVEHACKPDTTIGRITITKWTKL